MFEQIIREAEGLSAEELEEVVRQLQAMVLVALEGPEQEPERCPYCDCVHIVKKGFDKVVRDGKVVEKVQRYLCTVCHKTFTRRTLGLLAWSKLDAKTWSDYVGLELQRTSMADMAERLEVNVGTVHFMRLRLCQVMKAATPRMEVGFDEGCQVDGYYLNESLCGMGRRGGAEMPRDAHRSGHDVHKRGISNDKVCVACGVADDGRQFAELCDRGRPTDDAVRRVLEPRIGAGAVVSTDGLQAYGRILPELGVTRHHVFPSDRSRGDGLWRVNAEHRGISDFLRPYNGVSTRYLQFYLDFFNYVESIDRGERDLLAVTRSIVANGKYHLTRRMVYGAKRPFWDYWEEVQDIALDAEEVQWIGAA